jgi:hypothetical protein
MPMQKVVLLDLPDNIEPKKIQRGMPEVGGLIV